MLWLLVTVAFVLLNMAAIAVASGDELNIPKIFLSLGAFFGSYALGYFTLVNT